MVGMSDFPMPPGFKPPQIKPPYTGPKPKPEIEAAVVTDSSYGDGSQHTLNIDETAKVLNECLNPEHRDDPNILRFINSFVNCRDEKQAAHEAGITAGSGKILRNRPDIHKAIVALTDRALLKNGFDAHELIERTKEVMRFDPVDVMNPDGTFIDNLRLVPPEARRVIKKMKVKNILEEDPNGMERMVGKVIEFEFYDRLKGIEMLAPEKDVMQKTTKVQHDVTENMKDILLQSNKLADDRRRRMIDVTPKRTEDDGNP